MKHYKTRFGEKPQKHDFLTSYKHNRSFNNQGAFFTNMD